MKKLSNDGMRNDRQELFAYLATEAGVNFSTSWVSSNNQVNPDYVVVHKAPPAVVKMLVGMCSMVSMTTDGMLIPTTHPGQPYGRNTLESY